MRYLEPGEHVRLEARPHGVALARPLARALVLAVTGGGLVYFGSLVSWALGAVGAAEIAASALLALAEVVRWERTLLVLTSEKLLVVYGVVRRRGAAVRLSRVAPIELEQTLPGRVLGYGTLVAGDLVVPYVPASPELQTLLA